MLSKFVLFLVKPHTPCTVACCALVEYFERDSKFFSSLEMVFFSSSDKILDEYMNGS